MIKAEKLDTVTVRYRGTLTDGTLFDETPDEKPLKFIIGKQEVIAGFDEAVEGMFQGETRTFTIPYTKAYGERKAALIETIKRTDLPDDLEITAGARLEVTQEDDSIFHVKVTELSDSHVTLDANHPLAGEDLTFEIELLAVEKKPAVH
ncbi:MAG: peptidylprolyl isomerase [Desulfuromonas sp.]|nr:MAG: peptidylprolyl isomerase [Desulfuromonas sp.]